MNTIKVDDRYLHAIIDGAKTTTVRKGHNTELEAGDEITLAFDDATLPAVIVSIQHCTLQDLDDDTAQADGFNDRNDLLAALRTHYGRLELDDPMTVIEFEAGLPDPSPELLQLAWRLDEYFRHADDDTIFDAFHAVRVAEVQKLLARDEFAVIRSLLEMLAHQCDFTVEQYHNGFDDGYALAVDEAKRGELAASTKDKKPVKPEPADQLDMFAEVTS